MTKNASDKISKELMELTIKKTLLQGVTAHKEGNLQEAERLYRAIIQSHPAHPDANHNLDVGRVFKATGKPSAN